MKKALFTFLAALYSTFVVAQTTGGGDAKIDVNVSKSDSSWYTSPWVWIVVALVFILLLVALTRGRRD